jgi:hypothetical protein
MSIARRRIYKRLCETCVAREESRGSIDISRFGWFDSNKQLVPFVMFARLGRAPTGKNPVQQLDIRDWVLLRPPPVGEVLATGAAHLVSKELDYAVVNSIVVWFNDALAVFVTEPKQAFWLGCRPD